MNPEILKGSIVAIVTPMSPGGELDLKAFQNLLALHMDSGTAGIVVAGTTGEGASLSESEYEQLLTTAVAAVSGRVPVIAGIGSCSTAKSVRLAVAAAECSVDALLCVTPYYLRTTQDGLRQHFLAVADAVTLPVVLYNVPARTGVDLLPDTVQQLAKHPQMVAIKEAKPDMTRISDLAERVEDAFIILSGDDSSALDALNKGARGIISVSANVAPAAMQSMVERALAGCLDAAGEMDLQLSGLHRLLSLEPNPIPVKAVLARLGLIQSGIRLPLVPPSASLEAEIDRTISGAVRDLMLA